MSKRALVPVAKYTFPHEAELARIHLEAAGIPSVVMDDNAVSINSLYSNAMGGVRLMVHQDNLDAASAALNEDFSGELDDVDIGEPPPEAAEYTDDAADEITTCPRCGSERLEPHTRGRAPFLLTWFLLGAPMLLVKKGKKCLACGLFVPN